MIKNISFISGTRSIVYLITHPHLFDFPIESTFSNSVSLYNSSNIGMQVIKYHQGQLSLVSFRIRLSDPTITKKAPFNKYVTFKA